MTKPEDYSFIQKRRRKKLSIPMLITRIKGDCNGKTFFGYAKNISQGGMFIQSVNPKNVHEQFQIEFSLPGDDEVISSHVVVVWNQGYTKHLVKTPPGMGLKFLEINPDFSEKIRLWVETQQELEHSKDQAI